jgi:hypothetical protein
VCVGDGVHVRVSIAFGIVFPDPVANGSDENCIDDTITDANADVNAIGVSVTQLLTICEHDIQCDGIANCFAHSVVFTFCFCVSDAVGVPVTVRNTFSFTIVFTIGLSVAVRVFLSVTVRDDVRHGFAVPICNSYRLWHCFTFTLGVDDMHDVAYTIQDRVAVCNINPNAITVEYIVIHGFSNQDTV